MTAERILIVEDDDSMSQLIHSHLTALGYDATVTSDGREALRLASEHTFHLILLDITLPGLDGLEVCRSLRRHSHVPIVLVTAADRPETKILALEIGGDDYLTKPFHSGELVARVRAVLRRSAGTTGPETRVVEVGGLRIDLAGRTVNRDGVDVPLTRIEFDLLKELASAGGAVLSYARLLQSVWGPGTDDARLVHVHISNLRHKIEPSSSDRRFIIAVPGVGYRFRAPK